MAAPDLAAGPSEPRIIVLRTDDTALHLYRSVDDMLADADVASGGPLDFFDPAGRRLEPEYKSWRIVDLHPTDYRIEHAVLVARFGRVLQFVREKIESPVELADEGGLPDTVNGDLATVLAALWTNFGHSSVEPPTTVGNPLHNLFCH
jgi:hypothetical protein